MQLRMKHKEHGEKLVYLDDIPAHKTAGWVEATEADVPAEVVEDDAPKKRGRPAKVS
jgi:hypothetical protein